MNRKSKSKTEKSHTKDKHKNDHQIEAAAHAMTFAEMLRLQPEVLAPAVQPAADTLVAVAV